MRCCYVEYSNYRPLCRECNKWIQSNIIRVRRPGDRTRKFSHVKCFTTKQNTISMHFHEIDIEKQDESIVLQMEERIRVAIEKNIKKKKRSQKKKKRN